MIIENLGATFLSAIMALSSLGGLSGDITVSATPRASAQTAQFEGNTNFNWGSWGDWRGNKPVIEDIDPEEGPTGTTVTLIGEQFDEDNIVRFGRGAIHNPTVSDDGETLSFVIPEEMGQYCPPYRVCTLQAFEVDPGNYNVRVQDGFKSSNSVQFEVTENGTDPDEPLSIAGIDGPVALDTGEEGTWQVDVESEGEGNLQYSVKWGDEGWSPLRMFSADEQMQSSATFTHVYHQEGTYTPEFTVRDEDGNTVSKTSASVVVSDDDEDGIPVITSITPNAGEIGTMVTIMGHEFDADSEVELDTTSAENVDVVSDTKITFTVPSLAAGTYDVTVRDDDGISNIVHFTVTQEEDNGFVSVSGISAPTQLVVGEAGTWTVHADTNSEGNLTYAVDWGEASMMRSLMAEDEVIQSSATFTHAYQQEGTYTPKFTVRDEDGNTASVSATIVVEDDDSEE